jgi:hypothetical protein
MINEMERIEVVKKVIAQKSNWSHCNAWYRSLLDNNRLKNILTNKCFEIRDCR